MNNIVENTVGSFLLDGKCYHEVTLQKLNGRSTACYYNGKEYISLNPKDNECTFSYFRKLTEEPLYIDIGACSLIIGKMKESYRFVYFSKVEKNIDQIILSFQKIFPEDISLTIKNVLRDENRLLKSECDINDFDVKLKNWTYFSIDFQITYKYDNCLKNDCI